MLFRSTNITSVGTLSSLASSGLITASGGLTARHLYVTNGATFAGGIAGTLNTASQPNVTSVGTLTRLDVGSGGISSAGGITGTLNTAAQPNVTSVGTLSSLASSGLITASGGLTTNHLYVTNGATFAGTVRIGSITGGLSVTGGISISGGPTVIGVIGVGITAYGGTRFYSSAFVVSSSNGEVRQFELDTREAYLDLPLNVSGGINVTGGLSVTGGATVTGGMNVFGTFLVNGAALGGGSPYGSLQAFNAGITTNHLYVTNGATFASGIAGTLNTVSQPNVTSVGTLTRLDVGSGGISSAGGITGTLNTVSQPNVTSVGTLSSLGVSGLITASGGLTARHLYVTNGATFAGTVRIGSITGGLSVTGGATVTGGMNVFGTLLVDGAAVLGPSGFVGTSIPTSVSFVHTPHLPVELGNTVIQSVFVNSDVTGQGGLTAQFFYRWGADGNLSERYNYGYASSARVGTSGLTRSDLYTLGVFFKPPVRLDLPVRKIVDLHCWDNAGFGQMVLLENKSLTGWGFMGGIGGGNTGNPFPFAGLTFIDIATGLSGTLNPTSTMRSFDETAGWFLGLMDNGRLTGYSWPRNARIESSTSIPPASLTHDSNHPIFSRMPASLRSNAVSGLTAKAILSTDDAYCYALMADGSLTAWGATAFLYGGSGPGQAGSWTQGGTGGILANFPSAGETFTSFASTKAYRTVGFAIKSDGNLRCFGYTGNTPIQPNVGSGTTASVIADYRNIFCVTRTGDNQIVKIGSISPRKADLDIGDVSALWNGNSFSRGATRTNYLAGLPSSFYDIPYSTTGNQTILIGLTKAGTLTGGMFLVNDRFPVDSSFSGYPLIVNQTIFVPHANDVARGITLSNTTSIGTQGVLAKKAKSNSIVGYGPTSGVGTFMLSYGEFNLPAALTVDTNTTIRFGVPVTISRVPFTSQGAITNDPYLVDPLLDCRGSIIASQFAIVSDSSIKTNVENKSIGDGIVSQWKKDLLDNLSPKEFEYVGDPSSTKTIGYFAEDVAAANSKYVTNINPISIGTNTVRPPSLTADQDNSSYCAINLNTLMVGTIESLRELNTEMSRIWLTESPPYPSKIKNGDLWYYSGENRLYVRRNDAWIQVN